MVVLGVSCISPPRSFARQSASYGRIGYPKFKPSVCCPDVPRVELFAYRLLAVAARSVSRLSPSITVTVTLPSGVPCSRKYVVRARKGWNRVEYDLPGSGRLAFTNFPGKGRTATAGGTIAFEVGDLDRLMTDLKSKGVTLKREVLHSPVCRMAVSLDSGNAIQVLLGSHPQPALRPHGRRPRSWRLCVQYRGTFTHRPCHRRIK